MSAKTSSNATLAAEFAVLVPPDVEVPDAPTCLRAAKISQRLGDPAGAWRWASATVRGGDDYTAWMGAVRILDDCRELAPAPRRSVRVALLGSATTTQFGALLRLAASDLGVDVELYECGFGQYRQEILDEASALYRFAPDTVVLAVHDGALALPSFSDTPDEDVASEVRRWTRLWELLRGRLSCRILQFTFALDDAAPVGHLSARLPGSRAHMTQAVNLELGRQAGRDVALVDCERLSALFGKERWFDPRFWIRSKQAPSLAALPFLARHTAAVLAAELGLSRKCVVLDLDNTLWGGVIGEDGLGGIKLGGSGEGEAFVLFQEYLRELQRKGVLLAVVSKNNEDDAREPFLRHPEMRLDLDDIAVFIASWDPKPDQIRRIAQTLNIGLDALVFVDDNPVERQAVRSLVPEVDVVTLPSDPALYVRALSQYLLFETAAFTAEDAQRTARVPGPGPRGGSRVVGGDLRRVRGQPESARGAPTLRRRRPRPDPSAHRQDEPVQSDDTEVQQGADRRVHGRSLLHHHVDALE